MTSPIESFAERLLVHRKRKNLTQDDVAEHIGCSQSSISDWEKKRDKSSPTLTQMHLLAKLLGVSADYLLGLSDSPLGLSPDLFLVDLDFFESLPPGKEWAVKIPRRAKLVEFDEWRRMDADVRSRAKGKRKEG